MHVVGVENLIKSGIYLVAFRLSFFSLVFHFCLEVKEPLSITLRGKKSKNTSICIFQIISQN